MMAGEKIVNMTSVEWWAVWGVMIVVVIVAAVRVAWVMGKSR